MGDRLKIWYYTELKKLYALPWREKIEYIWNYYKLWIIGILCFLALTVFLIVRVATNVEGFWQLCQHHRPGGQRLPALGGL